MENAVASSIAAGSEQEEQLGRGYFELKWGQTNTSLNLGTS